jgi:hypothetical protein
VSHALLPYRTLPAICAWKPIVHCRLTSDAVRPFEHAASQEEDWWQGFESKAHGLLHAWDIAIWDLSMLVVWPLSGSPITMSITWNHSATG